MYQNCDQHDTAVFLITKTNIKVKRNLENCELIPTTVTLLQVKVLKLYRGANMRKFAARLAKNGCQSSLNRCLKGESL